MIVQTADPEIEARLRAEGCGVGGMSWPEQMGYRLLLSIDGNGAALSRNYIALASNSVLCKYSSENEAFYFKHLQDGNHYIRIETDAQVLDLLGGNTDHYEPIARGGRDFSERYLTPEMYAAYTARLLTEYISRMPTFVGSMASSSGLPKMDKTGKSLEDIGFYFGTDKSKIEHDFLNFYEDELRDFREKNFNLFEIGVLRGASLKTWATWFDTATCVGLDIDPSTANLVMPDNAHVRVGDAGDLNALRGIVDEFGRPTVVIDDGSHRWHHQITALHYFWPLIEPGGCFIMEDIHTSFPALAVEYRGLGLTSAYDYLVHLQRWVVGCRFMGDERAYDEWIERSWSSVRSIHWMRGTAIIWKKA